MIINVFKIRRYLILLYNGINICVILTVMSLRVTDTVLMSLPLIPDMKNLKIKHEVSSTVNSGDLRRRENLRYLSDV